ncbi:MAG: hypothetical protein HC772_11505 [Leptolyngbyaceae cyanobacterium CRU_2_3]|nr:hypothetical protein [Leptolyngbyaceae cyanobacterium CRU_2_3]
MGLPNTPVNRTFTQQKASQIELDIISGNFDDTLKKYKPKRTTTKNLEPITAGDVFEKFMVDQEKTKGLQVGSVCRYTGALRQLQRFFKDKPVQS